MNFNLADQHRFARLSGDCNPLHLDPIACRRLLFGEPIVHGIHLLLWSLEQFLADSSAPMAIADLEATFHNHLPLDTPVSLETPATVQPPAAGDAAVVRTPLACGIGRFEIRTSSDHCRVTGRFYGTDEVDPESWTVTLPGEGPELICEDRSLSQAVQAGPGRLPLFLNQAELRSMFPHLAERLPAVQVAQILATTRLTGMICPGMRSVFHALRLHFAPNPPRSGDERCEMSYEVCHSDERFSLLRLTVRSHGLQGELSTFVRPAPVGQPSLSEVAARVQPGEFRQQRALIVGGSRGLGELTAKIIAAGGGSTRLTYHQGKREADQLVAHLREAGADCRCFPLDVTGANVAEDVAACLGGSPEDWRPTHLYYFATPQIASPAGWHAADVFSPSAFARFCRFYLDGFARVVEAIPSENRRTLLDVFYPSTDRIDTLAGGPGEYAAAKSAGEVLGRLLQRRSRIGVFHAPRLPNLQTDQTASLRPRTLGDSLEVMLPEIRRFASLSPPKVT